MGMTANTVLLRSRKSHGILSAKIRQYSLHFGGKEEWQ